ncbi:hypothetical protein [Tritonibacter scottomollicae]|uniref:Uncharacterized protein n=1 Tax=Tritonibacter scottomollicae TaxID=483013 RepID=A0A2T1AAK0_TRISK|nr:hypothetical protein [Tritonibacter scottomollicae]PRZ45599.1 hypothetical protein CLV89_11450 [Tritonibacter scottomollicae]
MKRLMTKNWKVIAYIVGFVVLNFSPFEGLFIAYGLVGTAWLVIWLLRNNDGSRSGGYDINGDLMDSRNMHGSYYRDH